jgi:hypothetical protein
VKKRTEAEAPEELAAPLLAEELPEEQAVLVEALESTWLTFF